MKKKVIICIVLLIAVIVGAIVLLGGANKDVDHNNNVNIVESSNNLAEIEKGNKMSDIDKEPEEYTWEEFNSLKGSEQMAFQKSFDNFEDFEKWMNSADQEAEELPWENGGKQPEEYTWEEFNELEGGHQIKFQFAFEEEDGFEKWLEENEPVEGE